MDLGSADPRERAYRRVARSLVSAAQRGQPQLATQIVRLSGSAVMLPAYAGSGIGIVVWWSVFRSTW
jgi:hypothetical protein